MNSDKETNGTPKPRYYVLCQQKAGSPTGRESYGDGAPIVVCTGERPVHGEGATLEGGSEFTPWTRVNGQIVKCKDRKVLEMRNAETVLSIIRERGKQGKPLENIYRQMYNPDLYLRAYARIYRNEGAMTQGVTKETADGMALAKINGIIEALRYERYKWTPVRRIYIPKKKWENPPARHPHLVGQTGSRGYPNDPRSLL